LVVTSQSSVRALVIPLSQLTRYLANARAGGEFLYRLPNLSKEDYTELVSNLRSQNQSHEKKSGREYERDKVDRLDSLHSGRSERVSIRRSNLIRTAREPRLPAARETRTTER
jgi:hypothetical protein